jgi:hypothetical protein
MAFVGLATIFARLLAPLAPSRAATVVANAGPAVDRAELRKRLKANMEARPPIARIPVKDPDKLEVDGARANSLEPDGLPKPAASAAPLPEGPVVAIMLTELGPNAGAARSAIETLPPAVSLAFSPYADASPVLSREAGRRGHEVWLSVPMQPKSYPRVSPGANALLTSESAAENVRRLSWALGRVEGAIGVTNMMGSSFTESREAMRPVLRAVKDRGLVYVDARSSGRSVGEAEARALGVPAATNARFLDEPETAENIRANLRALVLTAKRQGSAIGYARAVPATIDELARWSKALSDEGVTLVGASTAARVNSKG